MTGHGYLCLVSAIIGSAAVVAYVAGDYQTSALMGFGYAFGLACGFGLLDWVERKFGP